jgi:hypothetical protein
MSEVIFEGTATEFQLKKGLTRLREELASNFAMSSRAKIDLYIQQNLHL